MVIKQEKDLKKFCFLNPYKIFIKLSILSDQSHFRVLFFFHPKIFGMRLKIFYDVEFSESLTQKRKMRDSFPKNSIEISLKLQRKTVMKIEKSLRKNFHIEKFLFEPF